MPQRLLLLMLTCALPHVAPASLSVSVVLCDRYVTTMEAAQIWESLFASNFGPEDYQVAQPTMPTERERWRSQYRGPRGFEPEHEC